MRRIVSSIAIALSAWGCQSVRAPFMPPVPASPREGEKPIPAGGQTLTIQNDHGLVSIGPARAEAGRVRYWIRAGAHTASEAERVAAATDVLVEFGGADARVLVVAPPLPSGGECRVDLEVEMPAGIQILSINAKGDILGNNLPPDTRLDAREGKVQLFGVTGMLRVTTAGSPIQIEGAPSQIDIRSTRGNITLWQTGAGSLSGRIESHSGLIQYRVQSEVSTKLRAMSQIGRVTCDLPLERTEATEHFFRGTLGAGEGDLEIVSYRGDIQILRPSP
ncbi:MAG: hypothetical protein JXP34_12995 [Planctomycetes bacterium]|nr:hypothetical protein [Planctomycetota bacterium]